jgi:hypothetical protein
MFKIIMNNKAKIQIQYGTKNLNDQRNERIYTREKNTA